MQDLLTPITTRAINRPDSDADASHIGSSPNERSISEVCSPDDALQALRSQPSIEQLSDAINWLDPRKGKDRSFNIKAPSPKASQIIFAIINDVIPSYWSVLNDKKVSAHARLRKTLVRCLNSISGIGAVASRLGILLKELSAQSRSDRSGKIQQIEGLVQLLEQTFKNDDFMLSSWNDLNLLVLDKSKRTLAWKELTSLLAGGRILALVAEVDHTIDELSPSIRESSWLSDGSQYAAWVGRNCACMVDRLRTDDQDERKAVIQLFSKALTLGYTDNVVESAFSSLLAGEDSGLDNYRALVEHLTANEQKNVLLSLIRILSRKLGLLDGASLAPSKEIPETNLLAGAAALFFRLSNDSADLRGVLIRWLTGTATSGVSQRMSVYRAVIAALSHDQQSMKEVFSRTLCHFGDPLYIKHTPILQQEVNVQVLLVVAGYLYRLDPTFVSAESKASTYINAISNRLSASSQRASILGMLVGTAISALADADGKRMNFSAEEVDSADGRWYQSLTSVQDPVGSISDLRSTESKTVDHPKKNHWKTTNVKPQRLFDKQSSSKIIAIEEIHGESESEDDNLIAYEKPDSDASDEDEDADLVQRNKPTAPVYIRELIAGLRDTENFDRHRLALSHTSSLIRRKANFGSEVSEHIEELATLLTGLSDKYNMDDFQKMRLQGMIAVIIAQPLKMGQWFSKTFFHGEYSMGQRASILTALGLGARELAGLKDEDASLTGADIIAKNPFPSRLLPDKLHKLYTIEAKPVDAISERMKKIMIKPMAVEAADQLSGPNALKVRTFSSRMEVEKRRANPIPNELAKIVADGFFFPLTGLWRMQLQAYGDQNTHTSPFLLSHYLKTLSLILHAAGTSPLSLPQMTTEFFDLLLSLRARASDPPVLEALLFSFLTLLDINSSNQRRLAEEHAKELLETREWVQMVFEKLGGGSAEGERVRILAAGVLMRAGEVVDRYQRLLLGNLVDFM